MDHQVELLLKDARWLLNALADRKAEVTEYSPGYYIIKHENKFYRVVCSKEELKDA